MEQVTLIGLEENEWKFALNGDIVLGNAEAFYAEVAEAYAKTPANLLFNCEKLNFIDSTTLGTFVKICNEAEKGGHAVHLTNLQPRIKKMFLICALDRRFQLD